jgi:hypothetical protein
MSSEFESKSATSKNYLLLLAVVGFSVQFVASWFQPHPGYYMMTDSPAYWGNAASLVEYGRIADTFFPMGVSILLAPFRALGFEAFSVVLWIHSLLNCANALLAYSIVRRFTLPGIALVAGLWVACYPPSINYARQLISEPWFVTTLLGALALMISPGPMRARLGGVLMGLIVLIRTPGLGILILVGLGLIWLRRPIREIWGFGLGALFVIGLGIILACHSSGKFVFLMTGTSMATGLRSTWDGYETVPDAERPSSYLAGAVEDPLAFMSQRKYAFMNITSPWPLGDDRSWKTKLAVFLSDAPILTGALMSVWFGVRAKRLDSRWLLMAPMVGLVGFYCLLFAISRYRMPYFPPLICLVTICLGPAVRDWFIGRRITKVDQANVMTVTNR